MAQAMKIIKTTYPECPDPIYVHRLGKYTIRKNRPIRVSFSSPEITKLILRNKTTQKDSQIKIYSDKTIHQQQQMKELKQELERRIQNGENNLVIKYIKVKSGKLDELVCIVSALHNVHVIVLSETWIKSEDEAQRLKLINYTHYYNYRSYSRGGGVSIYVHNSLEHNYIEGKSEEDNHYLWVHIEKFSIDIGAFYKPARTNANNFFQTFSSKLQEHNRAVIFGDFNFDLLKNESSVNDYKTILLENGFTILNKINKKFCTRETASSKTILDHVTTNLKNHDFHMAIIESALSDHKQIYFEIKQYEPNPTLRVRYEAVNYQGLYQDMLNMDYINDDYIRLEEAILTAIKRNKLTKFKFLNAPKNDWINSEVINKINKRNLLWYQYKKNPDNTKIKEQFRKERTKTFEYIQKTKNEYYFKAFKNCDGKSSKMWQLINNLTNNKIKHNFVPSKLVEPSQGTITDPQAICEHFNVFFAKIGIFLASQFPSQKPNATTNTVQPNNINKLTKFEFTTVEEVKLIINNLKSNSSKGIDGISVKAIKCLKDPISECLTNCINRCLQEGYFPDSLKFAKITPIYKSGPKDDPGNYRPISVLPVVSKIFEKIMHQRLCNFLNSNSYLFQGQYGFRSKSNTLTATIDLITKLKTKIDQKHVAVGIFIDLKKAFDTVSHDILISKLIELGIDASALQLLRSYLTNRFQTSKKRRVTNLYQSAMSKKKVLKSDSESEPEEWFCLDCGEAYENSNEEWIQYIMC
ncbi:unnamed protein product [Euphydryas editha]|uniref:Reverse transcriptase domain-containing protein n=1 Tax=Euphydryas editha TaxID=104508 RepID=A0AAU9TP64_EUPED|nr:unnamed protein product [Euphydryas editha]